VVYGAEAWTLTNKMEKNANDMGRKDFGEKYMAQHTRIDTGKLKLILN
jgi:hypothetical protein